VSSVLKSTKKRGFNNSAGTCNSVPAPVRYDDEITELMRSSGLWLAVEKEAICSGSEAELLCDHSGLHDFLHTSNIHNLHHEY